MGAPRTLFVPTGHAQSLKELGSDLWGNGFPDTRPDLGEGSGGDAEGVCFGLAGVYAFTAQPAAKPHTKTHVIEEGWPGARNYHAHSLPTPHHTTVAHHEHLDPQPVTDPKSLGTNSNFAAGPPGQVLAEIAPAEYTMLTNGEIDDPMDGIQIAADSGLVWLFTKPTHVLETMAGIYDPMAAAAVADAGTIFYSKDTTDGIDGTWVPMHGHVRDFTADPKSLMMHPIPASIKPLMTNVEGVKGLRLLGPASGAAAPEPADDPFDPFALFTGGGGSSETLTEWKIWIPKAGTASSSVTTYAAHWFFKSQPEPFSAQTQFLAPNPPLVFTAGSSPTFHKLPKRGDQHWDRTPPASSLGADGDMATADDGMILFVKSGGAWGPTGRDGSGLLGLMIDNDLHQRDPLIVDALPGASEATDGFYLVRSSDA